MIAKNLMLKIFMDFTGQQMSENFITDIQMYIWNCWKVDHEKLSTKSWLEQKNQPLENLRLYSTY